MWKAETLSKVYKTEFPRDLEFEANSLAELKADIVQFCFDNQISIPVFSDIYFDSNGKLSRLSPEAINILTSNCEEELEELQNEHEEWKHSHYKDLNYYNSMVL